MVLYLDMDRSFSYRSPYRRPDLFSFGESFNNLLGKSSSRVKSCRVVAQGDFLLGDNQIGGSV